MLDIRLVAAQAMEPLPCSRRDVLAPVRDSPDKRFGDAEDALRAAAEIEIVADVGSRERAELRRRESLQTAPRAGIATPAPPAL